MAGCYSPELDGCDIRCTPGVTQCPGELACSADGFCRGTDDLCDTPPTVGNLTSITTGNHHACALDAAGQLFCWGSNDFGQVTGDVGDPLQVGTKIEIAGVDHWTMIDAGGDHTCGIGVDMAGSSRVYCWGNNQHGQCAQTSVPTAAPQPITDPRLDAPVFVTAGNGHSCAITTDAQLLCWGANDHGQLGNGGTVESSDLTVVLGGLTWLDAAAGDQNTCARATNGDVYCWGRDSSGQIGDGQVVADVGPEPNPYTSPTMVDVSGLPAGTPTQLAVGFEQVCMTYNDPTVGTTLHCWGDNGSGQLGVPTGGQTNNFSTPQATQGLGTAPGWTAISAAGAVSCGINNGSVMCWGVQTDVLGDDCELCRDTMTMPGPHLDDAVKIHPKAGEVVSADAFALSVSEDFGCALYGDPVQGGVARCWGSNSHGNLATSGISRIRQATRSVEDGPWKLVRLAAHFGCGIKLDNSVWCWGDNSEGQANPASTAKFEPSPVQIDIGGEGAQDLALGNNHACVLYGNTGETPILCWGSNGANELGQPEPTPAMVAPIMPVSPMGLQSWTEVHAAANLTCAVLHDAGPGTDTYACWGQSSWHASMTPTMVTEPTASGQHLRLGVDTACALQNGNLMCWGTHRLGLRADGLSTDVGNPQFPATQPLLGPSSLLVGVREGGDIDPAGGHRCAITIDKTICWGTNGRHQAAVASGEQLFGSVRDLVVRLPGDDYLRTIASGAEFTLAVDASGHVQCWGDNTAMQCTRNAPPESSGNEVEIAVHVEQGEPPTFVTLAAGEATGCAVAEDGALYCWGDSARGETGLGAGAADQDFATTIVSQ